MVDDQVHVPLGRKLKVGTFWKDHTKYRVRLPNVSLSVVLHRGTVIDTEALNPLDVDLQNLRVTKFRATIGQDMLDRGWAQKSPYAFPDGQK